MSAPNGQLSRQASAGTAGQLGAVQMQLTARMRT